MVAVEPTESVVERSGAVVESGFTLVEEDDVAFTLQLCREVHRLYGDYQVGDLPSDEFVLAGLAVTMEMLAALSRRVTDGMPAMRITVAAAQTREMLAVMFGRDPLDGPLDGRFQAHWRAVVDESARALASKPAPLPANWADVALGRCRVQSDAVTLPATPALEPPADEAREVPPAPGDSAPGDAAPGGMEEVRRSRFRRLFGRRRG